MEFVDKITTRRSEQFVIKYPQGVSFMQKNKDNLNIHKCCNVCGKKLSVLPSGEMEETLKVDKIWGYFSRKDTVRHTFVVCEDCYDKWIASFAVAPEEGQNNEVL